MRSKEFGDTSLKMPINLINDLIKVSRRQLLRSLGFMGKSQIRDCSVRARAWLRLPVFMGEMKRKPLCSLWGAKERPGREAWLRKSGSWAKQRQLRRCLYQFSPPCVQAATAFVPLNFRYSGRKGICLGA